MVCSAASAPVGQGCRYRHPPNAYDTFQMPSAQPEMHISSPVMFADGRAKLEIRGSATGANFAWFRLEYGLGLYPSGWVQIGKDNHTPVTDGPLGEWDTTTLNGLYSLRLMVVRSDQRVDQAVVQVTLITPHHRWPSLIHRPGKPSARRRNRRWRYKPRPATHF